MQPAAVCPYCRSSLGSDELTHCRQCGTAHHFSCWQQNGKCAVFGCSSSVSTRISAAGEMPRLHVIQFLPCIFLLIAGSNRTAGVMFSFLFIPAMAICLYGALRTAFRLARFGFTRRELSRRQWATAVITIGVNLLAIEYGIWSWLRIQ